MNAFKVVHIAKLFGDTIFEKVNSYEVKHLHIWCVEVLTAEFWGYRKSYRFPPRHIHVDSETADFITDRGNMTFLLK